MGEGARHTGKGAQDESSAVRCLPSWQFEIKCSGRDETKLRKWKGGTWSQEGTDVYGAETSK